MVYSIKHLLKVSSIYGINIGHLIQQHLLNTKMLNKDNKVFWIKKCYRNKTTAFIIKGTYLRNFNPQIPPRKILI